MATNAIDLLKQDHEKVRGMLDELTDTTTRAKKTREALLKEIAEELRIHTQLEEEIFYPAFREAGKKKEQAMYYEAKEEHQAVENQVLPDLEGTSVDTEAFTGRAKVLKELIDHHAQEEEDDMFPRARELFSKEELEELGARMMELKTQLAS